MSSQAEKGEQANENWPERQWESGKEGRGVAETKEK